MLMVNSLPKSEGTQITQGKTWLWKFGQTQNLMVKNPMVQFSVA
jgi:predicted RecA/RadA family phage recombinase